jgi:hypothetical protein
VVGTWGLPSAGVRTAPCRVSNQHMHAHVHVCAGVVKLAEFEVADGPALKAFGTEPFLVRLPASLSLPTQLSGPLVCQPHASASTSTNARAGAGPRARGAARASGDVAGAAGHAGRRAGLIAGAAAYVREEKLERGNKGVQSTQWHGRSRMLQDERKPGSLRLGRLPEATPAKSEAALCAAMSCMSRWRTRCSTVAGRGCAAQARCHVLPPTCRHQRAPPLALYVPYTHAEYKYRCSYRARAGGQRCPWRRTW